MATDLAIDFNTGDLLIGSTYDLDKRVGRQTVEQRMRVRLRIIQGEWIHDPTGGTLGSNLRAVMRLPEWRAVEEVGLAVREALNPMADVKVQDVNATIETNPRGIGLVITYLTVEPTGETSIDEQQATVFVAV